MKRLLPILVLFLLLCIPALGEVIHITPVPSAPPSLTLLPSAEEVKVYAIPSAKANIVGYIIVGGQQKVTVLAVQGDWVHVSFTSVYGLSEGWVPRSCFEAATTPAPSPTPVPSVPQGGTAFVVNLQSGYRLNLRTSPSAESTSLGKYYTGTPVTLTGESRNGFMRVTIGSVSGWMDARYLTCDPYSFLSELPQVYVNNPGSGANLRYGPGTGSQRVCWYPHGTSVTVFGVRADGWYHVAVSGSTGYMSSSLLSQTFPWQYGTESDHPAVSGGINASGATFYLAYAPGTHLRQSAYAGSRSLGVFYSGCPVTVISYTRTGWAYVRICEMEGYVDAGCLSAIQPNRTGQTRTIVNPYGTGLNLRTLPTTASTVLTLCRNYTSVTVLGDLPDDWSYVLVNGQYGYMSSVRLER